MGTLLLRAALCLMLALLARVALADVIVPYPRVIRACVSLENAEQAAQGRAAIALLLGTARQSGFGDHVQLSIRNEADDAVAGDWGYMQRVARLVATLRPDIPVSSHLTRYERGVPFANRARDLCPAGQVQIGLVRTGFAPSIEQQNPCTPGRPSFCNVLCQDGACSFRIGSPGLPVPPDLLDTSTAGVHACLATMGRPMDATSLEAAEFLLSLDVSPGYAEEAVISFINWPGWSTVEADWAQAMTLARLVREKRPQVGAVSINVSSGHGSVRFLNSCSVGQARITLLRVGRPRVPLPCPMGWLGFCEVRCEDGKCGFHSPPIVPRP